MHFWPKLPSEAIANVESGQLLMQHWCKLFFNSTFVHLALKNNIQMENPQRELRLVDELHQSSVCIFFHKVARSPVSFMKREAELEKRALAAPGKICQAATRSLFNFHITLHLNITCSRQSWTVTVIELTFNLKKHEV